MMTMILAAALAQGASSAAVGTGTPMITEVRNGAGTVVARAMIWQGRTGLEVRIQAAGLAPGHYGVHFHAVGRCEGPAFASAGAHWNPTGRQHGKLNPAGHHLGDLDNLDVDEQGGGRLEFVIPGADMVGANGLVDADGAAVVIHAGPDDYRTDPSGNSGARLACGVFQANQVHP